MAESEVEFFSGVKTAQTAKRKVELKQNNIIENVKLKEDVPGAILLREKPEEWKVFIHTQSYAPYNFIRS